MVRMNHTSSFFIKAEKRQIMQRTHLILAIAMGFFLLTVAPLGQAHAKSYKMGELPSGDKKVEEKKKLTLEEARAAAEKSKQAALEKVQKDAGIKSKKDTKKHRTGVSPST